MYNLISRCYVMFNVSYMYCVYVIDLLYKKSLKLREFNIYNEKIEDKLYQSYLKLEEFMKDDYII